MISLDNLVPGFNSELIKDRSASAPLEKTTDSREFYDLLQKKIDEQDLDNPAPKKIPEPDKLPEKEPVLRTPVDQRDELTPEHNKMSRSDKPEKAGQVKNTEEKESNPVKDKQLAELLNLLNQLIKEIQNGGKVSPEKIATLKSFLNNDQLGLKFKLSPEALKELKDLIASLNNEEGNPGNKIDKLLSIFKEGSDKADSEIKDFVKALDQKVRKAEVSRPEKTTIRSTENFDLNPGKKVQAQKTIGQEISGIGSKLKNQSTDSSANTVVTGSSRNTAVSGYNKLTDIHAPKLNANELIHKVVKQIQSGLVNGKKFVSVKIYPEHLGRINIVLNKEDASITGKLFVDNAAVKELLESKMQFLKDHLNQAGFEFTELSVDVSASNQNQADQAMAEKTAGIENLSRGGSYEEAEAERMTADIRYTENVLNLVA